jgi:TRAP-type uncharacterized transport system fused permease subunit
MAYSTIFLGTIIFSALSMGYFLCPTNIPEWALGALGAILLMFPNVIYDTIGLNVHHYIVDAVAVGLFVAVYLLQKIRIRQNPKLLLPLKDRK